MAAGFIALASPGPEWAAAVIALLAGTALLAVARPAEGAYYAGVAARIDDPRRRFVARAAVILTAPLAGVGVAVYTLGAFVLTMGAGSARRAIDWRTVAGTGFAGLAVVVAADAAGLTVGSEGLLWCVLLLGSGLSLFWGAVGARGQDPLADAALNTWLGVVLILAGTGVILNRAGAFGLDAETIVGACAVLVVLAFVFVPRWLRTRRQLAAERRRRERQQHRAEIGEMLHDSVLQTLALIQRREDTSPAVAALARRQERELRDWLLRGETVTRRTATMDEGLRTVVAEIEDDHEVMIETVIVGDTPRSPAVDALLAASREALLNAVKHGGGTPVALFAKADGESATVYVRDRGPGFDPHAIGPDRHGIRVSIFSRIERVGGRAEILSDPGHGCEVIIEVAT